MLYIFPLFTVIFPEKKARTSGIHFICTSVDIASLSLPAFLTVLKPAGVTTLPCV